jgi:hypothetical protein
VVDVGNDGEISDVIHGKGSAPKAGLAAMSSVRGKRAIMRQCGGPKRARRTQKKGTSK